MIGGNWKETVKETSPLIAIMMLVEVSGGGMMQASSEIFVGIPIILSLVPLINALGGNIGSILGSRLASGLHLGTIKPALRDREVADNMFTAAFIGLGAELLTATFLYLLFPFLGLEIGMNIVQWTEITVLASITVISLVLPIAVMTAVVAFKKGKSPDDFTIPVSSTAGDFIGILSIIIAVKMVGL